MQQFSATKHRARQAFIHTAGLGVYVNLTFVCFHFNMAVSMPDTLITSYGSCQNVCFKYLSVSLKY